ncbi:homoserine kinase [Calidifontibacter terrae]
MGHNEIQAGSSVRVDVPASSANLGPGFDSLGLGLELRDVLEVRCTGDELRIEVEGEGADEVPLDPEHLIHRSMLALWEKLGVTAPKGLHLSCVNAVPHSRGLGSSAAAIVAGVTAAYALTGRDLDAVGLALINDVASSLEGHPDNASASVYGGYTVSWWDGAAWQTVRPQLHPEIRALALVPDATLSTDKARSALPGSVPFAAAARNAGRAALMTHAMTADPAFLFAATADWLHQENRRPAYPGSMAVVDRLRADGLAAFVSGAGPTVLVLGGAADLDRVPDPGAGWRGLRVDIARAGVRAISHIL